MRRLLAVASRVAVRTCERSGHSSGPRECSCKDGGDSVCESVTPMVVGEAEFEVRGASVWLL